MPFPAEIAALVETFAAHEGDYTSPEFKEAQLRQQFLDPLFAALGWDVANTAGYAEAYKEVIHEDALKIGGETKAPDYSFRVGGQRKFFVEAKKPAVLIKDNPEPAYQLRRYSWSAKLPLGILTDFQEFAVYDTRVKPAPTDKASAARLFYCRYDELEKHWAFIAGTFSKEAVLKGSFDKYAATTKGKRGTATVDDAFLKEIEQWRELLARNLALRNPALDVRGLNFAVQRIIDRIVFLRIAEDRGNEPFGQLQALLGALPAGGGALEEEPAAYGGAKSKRAPVIYPRLVEIFEKADYRYNSGLFHFAKDADCAETPDTLTPGLLVDDAVLKQILGSLYYPQSPYVFTVLPAYILGHVYEQFLGKVIRLTEGHQAKVEEKPEVRKAGGVYYTPQYIVDYIVQKTLDPLLADQTPKQIETLAVLDPACGSGTFLLGAYDHLLKWYLAHYSAHAPEKWAKQGRVYETAPNANWASRSGTPEPFRASAPARSWQLTTAERRRILLAHIHGVDIDAAAVEVTKLSLLLKVLEGERREYQGKTKEMSAVLPDLSRNIKCGNSLIGHDFYNQPDLPTLDAEAKYKLNTFEWKDGFPEIIKRGGFDAVIGNPPYIRIQTMTETSPESVGYLSSRYKSAAAGNYDIYVCFVERALDLLNKQGVAGHILPHKFFNAEYGEPLRASLSAGKHVSSIVHFGDQQIFEGATTYTCLLFVAKKGQEEFCAQAVNDKDAWRVAPSSVKEQVISTSALSSSPWSIGNESLVGLLKKYRSRGVLLSGIADLFVGLQTDADDIFIVEEIERKGGRVLCESKATGERHWLEDKHLKRFLKGSLNIRRYHFSDATKRLVFPYDNSSGKSILISPKDYRKNHPLTWNYLERNRDRLSKRAKGILGDDWHGYVYKKNHLRFDQVKLLVPAISQTACFTLDEAGDYYFVGSGGGGGGGYGITLKADVGMSPYYVLAILNSRLTTVILKQTSTPFRGGYFALNKQYIESLSLPKASKDAQEKLGQLSKSMLALHRAQAAAQSPHEKDALAKQITATDRQIDAIVYQLYGLTPDEIALVEGTAS